MNKSRCIDIKNWKNLSKEENNKKRESYVYNSNVIVDGVRHIN